MRSATERALNPGENDRVRPSEREERVSSHFQCSMGLTEFLLEMDIERGNSHFLPVAKMGQAWFQIDASSALSAQI